MEIFDCCNQRCPYQIESISIFHWISICWPEVDLIFSSQPPRPATFCSTVRIYEGELHIAALLWMWDWKAECLWMCWIVPMIPNDPMKLETLKVFCRNKAVFSHISVLKKKKKSSAATGQGLKNQSVILEVLHYHQWGGHHVFVKTSILLKYLFINSFKVPLLIKLYKRLDLSLQENKPLNTEIN